jgi:hypothetical protein
VSAGVPACAACSWRASSPPACGARPAASPTPGEDLGPAAARYKPRQRGEPGPVSRLVPHPAGVPPQYRVLMPDHQQLSILRQVTAEHQDGQAEYPAREQVDDPEQYPPAAVSTDSGIAYPGLNRRLTAPPPCPAARDFSGNSPKRAPAEEPGGYDLITVPGFRAEALRHVTPTDIKSVTRFHLRRQVRYPVCLGIGQMPFTDHRPAIRPSQSHPRRSRYRPKAWLPRLGGTAASLVLCAVRTSLAAYRS